MKIQDLLQLHAKKCDAQQEIVDKAIAEGRGLSDEESKSFEGLQKDIDGLKDTIDKAELMEKRNLELSKKHNPNPAPMADPSYKQEDKLDDGGFKNLGEFLYCLKNGDRSGRLQNLSTTDVGVMIPPQYSQNLMSLNGEDELIMPRATVIPAGDPPDAPFTIPYFDQGTNGELGGISLTWTNEAAEIQDVGTPGIKDLTLTPQEVSGLAIINNKTLANWSASGAFMQNLMRQAWINGRDTKFLSGNGVGCPQGILDAGATGAKVVARDTAGTIKYIDTLNMLAGLYAGPGEPVYIANQTSMPTFMTMVDPANRYIYNAGDATKGIPATLNGIRIMFTGKSPLLAAKGGLILAKLNYYLIKPGSGPFVDISKDYKFNTNQTAFRIVANIDGELWVKNPLTLQDGSTTVSPVVVLNA